MTTGDVRRFRVRPCEPHSDQCAVLAVPHDRGNYQGLLVHSARTRRQRVSQLHGPTVATTFDIAVVTTPGNHIPIGALDCNGSGLSQHE